MPTRTVREGQTTGSAPSGRPTLDNKYEVPLLETHLEILMITRRIVISACALSLAVSAPAGASPAKKPPKAKGPYGITSTTYPSSPRPKARTARPLATYPKLAKAKGPYGTPLATYPKLAKAKGPYGTTPATYPNLVEPKGPYGMTTAPSSQDTTTRATAHAAAASTYDGLNDWRTAAISEAALLAALALGSALLLAGRRRAPRLGT
jgi:hypothetical protein